MTTSNHLVSVVMPVFNAGDHLRDTLESVSSQIYPHVEIIVVDDGSTDNSKDVIASLSQRMSAKVTVLMHPEGQRCGMVESYRLGLEYCHGKYIAFLEHDDIWAENKISEQVRVMEALPKVGVVFSDVYLIDEKGRISDSAFKTWINRPPSGRPFNAFWKLLWGNCILTFSNVMVRKTKLRNSDILTAPEGFQDWMLLILLSTRCRFYLCAQTKIFWRQQQNSFHANLRQLSSYRKQRKLAQKNAMNKILNNQIQSSYNSYKKNMMIALWNSIIFLVSGAERTAYFLNRNIWRRNKLLAGE